MAYIVEQDFISKEGLRCVGIAITDMGHRCGYVGVPKGHVLYGVGCSDTLPVAVSFVTEEIVKSAEMGSRGAIPILLAVLSGNANRLDVVIDVHGSLTYSGCGEGNKYPVPDTDLWWFGFDCSHCDDGKDLSIMDAATKKQYIEGHSWYCNTETVRSKEYVEQHLRLLSIQLWYINQMVGQAALPEGEKK